VGSDGKTYQTDIRGDESAVYGVAAGTTSVRGSQSPTPGSTPGGEGKVDKGGGSGEEESSADIISSGGGRFAKSVPNPFLKDDKWAGGVLFRRNIKSKEDIESHYGVYRQANEVLTTSFSSYSPLAEWAVSHRLVQRYPLHFSRRYSAGEYFPRIHNAICNCFAMSIDRKVSVGNTDFRSTLLGVVPNGNIFSTVGRHMIQIFTSASNGIEAMYSDIGCQFEWDRTAFRKATLGKGLWVEGLTGERYAPWFFERVFGVPYGVGVSSDLTPEILDSTDALSDFRYARLFGGTPYLGEGKVRSTWLQTHVVSVGGRLTKATILRTPHISDIVLVPDSGTKDDMVTVGTVPVLSMIRSHTSRSVMSVYADDPHPRELKSVSNVSHPRSLVDPRGRSVMDNVDIAIADGAGALFRM
jgi:hypothetical protein